MVYKLIETPEKVTEPEIEKFERNRLTVVER